MNPQATQLQLRDIHLPDAVPWWPPAPGYWLLLVLLVIGLLMFWWLRKRHQQKAVRRAALQELAGIRQRYQQDQNAQQLVMQLSALLRRAAISSFPRSSCAALTGLPWLQWLDQGLQSSPAKFTDSAGQLLLSAPYQKSISAQETETLITLCQQWLTQLPAPAPHQGDAR